MRFTILSPLLLSFQASNSHCNLSLFASVPPPYYVFIPRLFNEVSSDPYFLLTSEYLEVRVPLFVPPLPSPLPPHHPHNYPLPNAPEYLPLRLYPQWHSSP